MSSDDTTPPAIEMPRVIERKCQHAGCENWFELTEIVDRIYCGRRSCAAAPSLRKLDDLLTVVERLRAELAEANATMRVLESGEHERVRLRAELERVTAMADLYWNHLTEDARDAVLGADAHALDQEVRPS